MSTTSIQKPVLSLGSRGEAVEELQQLLNLYGNTLTVDGIFGVQTEAAVRDYQFIRFLDNDGIVGNKTWQALFSGAPVDMPVLSLNSRGSEVRIVQVILAHLLIQDGHAVTVYYTGPIDEQFGPMTEQAVKAFQAINSLPDDGIVGDRTWHALSKHGALRYENEPVA